MVPIMEVESSWSVMLFTFVWASSRKAACNAVTWERRALKSTALPAADNLRTKESRLTSTPSISVLKFPSHELFKSRLFRALASVLISAFILLMGLLSIGISIFLSCACNLAICALICFVVFGISNPSTTCPSIVANVSPSLILYDLFFCCYLWKRSLSLFPQAVGQVCACIGIWFGKRMVHHLFLFAGRLIVTADKVFLIRFYTQKMTLLIEEGRVILST